MGELNSIASVTHKAHDMYSRQKRDTEMSPRFRVAHNRSTTGPFKSQVSIAACYAQHRVALCTSSALSIAPPFLCYTCISAHFVPFLQHFYNPETLTVTASSDNCDNSSHFQIIVARADRVE